MKTSYNQLRKLIVQELNSRGIGKINENVDLDTMANAASDAMEMAEEESMSRYGEVDIERLAVEKGVQPAEQSGSSRGMTPGEKYIDDLKQQILAKLV
jgi:hypothetical protein